MRCLYCYNPNIVNGESRVSKTQLFELLHKRQGLLDAVVISGGEATLYPELLPLCKKIKSLGYKIKLDTNGCRPKIVTTLLNESLLDYVALDFKAPRSSFQQITNSKLRFESFDETLKLLCQQSSISFEVRTTMHTDLLSCDDIKAIQEHLLCCGYNQTHYLQLFREAEETLGNLQPPSKHFELDQYLDLPLPIEIR